MNYKMVLNILGKVLLLEGFLLLFPMMIDLIYQEQNFSAYLYPIIGAIVVGTPLTHFRRSGSSIYAKEGFVTVSLAWIIMSLVGAIPFMLTGVLPSFFDAFFETVSGFTTTGSSVILNVEIVPKSILFWRGLMQFVGGMGVLVFVLAITPKYSSGVMHVLRAESPGPSVGKLVSKMSHTARILYAIYTCMTAVLVVLLLFGGMPVFESVVHSFSLAGTGGFGTWGNSIAHYDSTYINVVMSVFMFLFSTNFNVFYLILIGSVKKALRSEELRAYLIILGVSTIAIAINILSQVGNFFTALEHSFFQVTSVSSTTGFASTDFNTWPDFSKAILLVLMIIGACGGSTGGGMKVSRLVILVKSVFKDIKRTLHPRSVNTIKFEKEPLAIETERNVRSFFSIYMIIIAVCTILLCLDVNDFITNFSATLSCLGNIGPGLNLVGPMANFSLYSDVSKMLLSLVMLVGRLEIFPMLLLFVPRTWKKGV